MALQMPHELMRQMWEHVKRAYPEECCGFLGGTTPQDHLKVVQAIRPVDNARDESRRTRYVIHPAEFKRAEETWEQQGLGIVGIYHSHPDHPAQPSPYDQEHAWPWYSYLVISVQRGEIERARSWVLREDRSQFDEEEMTTLESGGNAS